MQYSLDPVLTKYRISAESIATLNKQKGIYRLFPIQAATFDFIFDGNDLVGRARTGTGKTFSFALPVLERMFAAEKKGGGKPAYGRPPRALDVQGSVALERREERTGFERLRERREREVNGRRKRTNREEQEKRHRKIEGNSERERGKERTRALLSLCIFSRTLVYPVITARADASASSAPLSAIRTFAVSRK